MAELQRTLGFGMILFLAISSIMGTGMFFGAAVGSSYSGNASIISWLILWVVAIYISLYFGELVTLFPTAGGVYEFAKHAYNRFFSFMMGWLAWLVGNLTSSLLIVAAIDYLIPDQSKMMLKISICISVILLLNIIAFFGVEASGIVVVILSSLSIALVISVIAPGAFHVHANNFEPFLAFGLLPVFLTIFFIAESFFGWESVTYLSEEAKNPKKDIPKALLLGTLIVGILAIGIVIVSLGIIPWRILSTSSTSLSLVFDRIYGSFGSFFNYAVAIALLGSAAGSIVSMPRLILALARDKLFIAQLADVHPKYKSPHKAIAFQTIVGIIALFMTIGNYKRLLSLMVPLAIIMYVLTFITVPILRRKYPSPREWKVPFANLGTLFLVGFLLALIGIWLFFEPNALSILRLGLSLIAIGIPIYLLLELYYDPDAIVKTNDALAFFTLLGERIILPKKVIKEILSLLGDIKNKTVLEFGCSVGTLTLHLAEQVKPQGHVFATDLSKKDLLIAYKRMRKRGHYHVHIVHDEHQMNRVHPSIPHVDAIISIGMMGYLQDVKKVLREMRDLLPYNGRIVFVDYADFFKIIPNVAWLSNDQTIEQIFRDSGFSVYVTRKKGLFWNYVYVYGIKFHENIPFI